MRVAGLLAAVLLAGCTAGGVLRAEPLSALDGSAVVPIALAVEPLDPEGAAKRLGLDPAPLGVSALEVRVINRSFAPLALPEPGAWVLYDGTATEELARALAPGNAAHRVAEALRAAGGTISGEEERQLAARWSRRALASGELPSGGTAAGLVFLVAEDGTRLDPAGLVGRFLAAPLGAGEEPGRLLAGRLRAR
jgi:hypothetical protein